MGGVGIVCVCEPPACLHLYVHLQMEIRVAQHRRRDRFERRAVLHADGRVRVIDRPRLRDRL